MSTFGNKALVWWNYHQRDRATLLRFNATDKDFQLQLLNKWYPIGMMVGLGSRDDKYQYEIVEYIEHITWWSVKVIWRVDGSIMNGMQSTRNPLSLYPSPDWEKKIKREHKISRIL